MTPSQRKAINSSDTMIQMVNAQRLGAKVVKTFSDHNETLNIRSVQVQTETTAYNWIVTPRGRIVEQDIVGMM